LHIGFESGKPGLRTRVPWFFNQAWTRVKPWFHQALGAREAVVGGPSLVFTRYHEFGFTKIRSHQIAEPRLCKRILGYDANALYLSTMLKEMPCGKENVVH